LIDKQKLKLKCQYKSHTNTCEKKNNYTPIN
jgi:hypothetical protein